MNAPVVAFHEADDKRDQVAAVGAIARLRWKQLVAQLFVCASPHRAPASCVGSEYGDYDTNDGRKIPPSANGAWNGLDRSSCLRTFGRDDA